MSQALAAGASVDPQEVARFSRIAAEWWDPRGPLGALHKLNPVRLGFIRDHAVRRFGRDDFARAPFAGLSLLDVGCGGGLLCEPMRRLGFDVTGVDASPENIGVASAHSAEMGLDIAYRCVTAEGLRAEGARFDVVLNMEVVEHTADPGQFLRDTSALVAPGGMMVIATLNRTLKSFALAKVAAEYVLGWAPRGAHDWRKFLKPDEIKDHLASEPVEVRGPFGVVYSPMSDSWSLSPDTDINFMMTALKGAPRG